LVLNGERSLQNVPLVPLEFTYRDLQETLASYITSEG